MARSRLSAQQLADFSRAAPAWSATESVLEGSFSFSSYADGVAFAVAVALAADRRDHHPDLTIGYRRVRVAWSTHDAGGTTVLDREMATETDAIAGRHGAIPGGS
jgi:4a-hydroxytetrahydrobiopterin dehydratase